MANIIKVTTDNKIQILDVPVDENGALTYEGLYHSIGNIFDIVRIYDGSYVFLCDGDGWARFFPDNRTGAFYYNGNPIPGDIIFCIESGPDLYPIDDVGLFIYCLVSDCSWLSYPYPFNGEEYEGQYTEYQEAREEEITMLKNDGCYWDGFDYD